MSVIDIAFQNGLAIACSVFASNINAVCYISCAVASNDVRLCDCILIFIREIMFGVCDYYLGTMGTLIDSILPCILPCKPKPGECHASLYVTGF